MTRPARGADGAYSPAGSQSSAAERVATLLRDEILRGVLAPATPLREVSLSERFDVSRTTVREAIRLLGAAGLVRHRRHHGAVVADPTPQDLAEIQRARAVLEQAAAEAVAHALPSRLAGLGEAVERMADAVAARDTAGVVEADLSFHRALVGLLDSRRVSAWHAALQDELRLGLAVADRRVADPDKVAAHRRLAALAAARDVGGLRSAVGQHLESSAKDVLRAVGQRSE